MKRSGITGAIHGQILHPNLNGVMPAKLVTGDEAYDVAAYVAQSVAAGGKDSGLLATAVKQAGGGKPAVEKNGNLQIDADPTGQLAFVTDTAQGTPGKITVKMGNKSGTPHDIVIDGKGKGEVVQNGGVSQFSADLHGRELHVLLLGAGPSPGRHAGQAHRQVVRGCAAYPFGALKTPLVAAD